MSTTLEVLAALGRPLFSLFDHPAPRVADGLAGLMRCVAECGATTAAPMREAALREGALLLHLKKALFTPGARAALSQQLVASWCDEFAPALTLLRQILPPGLVRYLNVPKTQPTLPPPKPQVQQSQPSEQSATGTAASGDATLATAGVTANGALGLLQSAGQRVTSAATAAAAAVTAAASAAATAVSEKGTPLTQALLRQSQQQQQVAAAGEAGAATDNHGNTPTISSKDVGTSPAAVTAGAAGGSDSAVQSTAVAASGGAGPITAPAVVKEGGAAAVPLANGEPGHAAGVPPSPQQQQTGQ